MSALTQREEDTLMLSCEQRPQPSLLSSFKTIFVWMSTSGFLTHTLLGLYCSSCYCPKVPVWVRTQTFALFQLWNGCEGNRTGCNRAKEVFLCLVKPMRLLQKPLLNLVQGQSMGRSRENEAKGCEKKIKEEQENRRQEMALWLPGTSQHGRPASGVLFPLFSYPKLSKAIIKIPVFPKHCKRRKQSDPNILGYFCKA